MRQDKFFKEDHRQPKPSVESSCDAERFGLEYTPVRERVQPGEYVFMLPSVSITVTKHLIRGYVLEQAIIW